MRVLEPWTSCPGAASVRPGLGALGAVRATGSPTSAQAPAARVRPAGSRVRGAGRSCHRRRQPSEIGRGIQSSCIPLRWQWPWPVTGRSRLDLPTASWYSPGSTAQVRWRGPREVLTLPAQL